MARARTWRCQKQSGGKKCGHDNPTIKRNCQACGKPRTKSKPPAHRSVLDLPYEAFLLVNGGSHDCGICGQPPSKKRKNDRDHEHKDDGLVRGLLCHGCNRTLSARMQSASRGDLITWLRAAANYLERAERWRGINLEKLL